MVRTLISRLPFQFLSVVLCSFSFYAILQFHDPINLFLGS